MKSSVDALTQAIELVPAYVDAHYHRARAYFLQAEIERRRGGDGKSAGEAARADVGRVLDSIPEFLPARYLRGIVNFSLGRDAEAVADWRALIRADASWDSADVRSWIERAEGRLKK